MLAYAFYNHAETDKDSQIRTNLPISPQVNVRLQGHTTTKVKVTWEGTVY